MLGLRKQQELTDDELLDWLVSRCRALTIGVFALAFGGTAVIAYLILRGQQRDDETRLQSCATIYDSRAGNPYVQELIEAYPDCGARARRDGRPSVTSPTPSRTSAVAIPSRVRGPQIESPAPPSQGPTGGAEIQPSSPTRTPRATATVTRTAKNPARPIGSGSSGVPSHSASAAATRPPALLCASLAVGPIRVGLGCS